MNMTDPSSPSPEWEKARNAFLFRRADSGNFLVSVLKLLSYTCVTISIGAMFFVFSINFQKDDPAEVMFPAILEITTLRHCNDVVQKIHFVRPRRFIWDLIIWTSVGFGGFTAGAMGSLFNVAGFPATLAALLGALLGGFGFGPPLAFVVSGLAIQIQNATTLSNMLVQCVTNSADEKSRFAHFGKWKEAYKTSIGALHIWSWRTTPIFGGGLLYICSRISLGVVLALNQYMITSSEPDIPEEDRITEFLQIGKRQIAEIFTLTIFLLLIAACIAQVATRYKRLHLLIATVLPWHDLDVDDDFRVLQLQNAALTIYDIPITMDTTVAVLKLLFIESAVGAVSVLG